MSKRSALLVLALTAAATALLYLTLTACDGGDECKVAECVASCAEQGYENGACVGSSCDCLGEQVDGDADSDAEQDAEGDGDGEADAEIPPDPCEEAGHPCTSAQRCVDLYCADPVYDYEAYAAAAAGRTSSYWWALQLPSAFTDLEGNAMAELCCFDLTGDGTMDNSFGTLLGMMAAQGGELSPQGSLDAAIAEGEMMWVLDWVELPAAAGDGPARVSFFGAVSDDDFETRAAGGGTYRLERSSFGTHGAEFQINQAQITGGELTGGPSTIAMGLPMAGGEGLLMFNIYDARIAATVEIQADGLHTVDEDRPDTIPSRVAGGRLGGIINGFELLGGLDEIFRGCACAGVDPSLPVIEWAIGEEGIELDCTANTGTGGECPESPLCGGITQLCQFLDMIAIFFDVDSDADGIKDSISIGLRFGWTGAEITGLEG